ncbi:hypothetical protein ANOM_006378 [Aspergillus nomiae NRRL 13137]|uniref:Zn(2)-C6 fungal-type domain-containing protein n=1 Tax=Aspergillus nomiae NRRL (strain ATCC 15546 / NRRL 13137 / CBS 260.88 / M93) TaxID=1509407 RepID=A0A0L1J1I1_ASPN3|nr:uncharacterized protein ANOM_006378 [Aspergillus nomiae NRRL 13137]KNG85283.1 hypothetical protein ANOM_006378 [Aspergillus nomiae NRRL 13137]
MRGSSAEGQAVVLQLTGRDGGEVGGRFRDRERAPSWLLPVSRLLLSHPFISAHPAQPASNSTMAPSTATPTDLHRASAASACLACRKAKVRCLISQRRDRCDRCIANASECVFTQTKRARVRARPYPQGSRREPRTADVDNRHSVEEVTSTGNITSLTQDEPGDIPRPRTSHSQRAISIDHQPQLPQHQQPITNAIRARIIAALVTLKGKRGAPFSFVTSGDSPTFSVRNDGPAQSSQPESFEQSEMTPHSLKLSWLLRPLHTNSHHNVTGNDSRAAGVVKMPTYLSSMTLGQTIKDPIEGGMIIPRASKALFQFFMIHMNAKWEYILDPNVDTHDDVQRRSSLLFTSILFCASKFATYVDGCIVSATDPFVQSRLCSLARNLVIRTMAEGDRSIETMQALYLLVCWKDPDDDVSYLHSGYAFRILDDLDVEQCDGDGWQVARRRRIWLALYRQDRQQSLFFMRRPSLSRKDEDISLLSDMDTWLKMQYVLPSDFIACCSADLRRIQSRLRGLVQRASSTMLPCLSELMDTELGAWRSKWKNYFEGKVRTQSNDDMLLNLNSYHLTVLIGLWEHSVRLNVASAILRQSLMASVASFLDSSRQPGNVSIDLDLTTIQETLPSNLPGLTSSVEGAFGTLRNLINFPPDDLRRAPDAILLLAPNAALFLCLLLCLPGNSSLGPAFQRTTINLIRDITQHIKQAVLSPQDTIALHSAYLDSLADLLGPDISRYSAEQHELEVQPIYNVPQINVGSNILDSDDPALQAARVLADGIGGHNYRINDSHDGMFSLPEEDANQNLHVQLLANLLDGDIFWEPPP